MSSRTLKPWTEPGTVASWPVVSWPRLTECIWHCRYCPEDQCKSPTVWTGSSTGICCHWNNYSKLHPLKKKIYLFSCARSHLQHSGSSIFTGACGIFSWGMWDLVPWPRIELGTPWLGVQSLSLWTTREVPSFIFFTEGNLGVVFSSVSELVINWTL